jgi:hypothetical protein
VKEKVPELKLYNKEIDMLKEDNHFPGTKDFSMDIFFFCSIFGHKVVNCYLRFGYDKSKHSRNRYLLQQKMKQPSNKQSQTVNHVMAGKRAQVKHKNHYDPLFNEP